MVYQTSLPFYIAQPKPKSKQSSANSLVSIINLIKFIECLNIINFDISIPTKTIPLFYSLNPLITLCLLIIPPLFKAFNRYIYIYISNRFESIYIGLNRYISVSNRYISIRFDIYRISSIYIESVSILDKRKRYRSQTNAKNVLHPSYDVHVYVYKCIHLIFTFSHSLNDTPLPLLCVPILTPMLDRQ